MDNKQATVSCLRNILSLISPDDRSFDIVSYAKIREEFSARLFSGGAILDSEMHDSLPKDLLGFIETNLKVLLKADSCAPLAVHSEDGYALLADVRKSLNMCIDILDGVTVKSVSMSTTDKPMRTVFYTWQNDTDRHANRNFIKKAIEKAIKEINRKGTKPYELRIDHDTLGVPGAVSITDTIAKKIVASSVFIADVTPITGLGEKGIPNPNVMWETGYAYHALGANKIILVRNEYYSRGTNPPFDIAGNRTLQYNFPLGGEKEPETKEPLNELVDSLSFAITEIIEWDEEEPEMEI